IYRVRRANQSRGISELAPVEVVLQMVDGFEEAAVMHARAAACQMFALVKKSSNNPFDVGGAPSGEAGSESTGGSSTDVKPGDQLLEATPAGAMRLPEGWEIQSFEPNHPNADHPEVIRSFIRKIS